MARFRAATENRFLQFDKISDLRFFFHFRFSAKMRHRSDGALIGNFRIGYHRVIENFDAVTDFRIRDARATSDSAAVADLARAFDGDMRKYHGVAPDLRFGADV